MKTAGPAHSPLWEAGNGHTGPYPRIQPSQNLSHQLRTPTSGQAYISAARPQIGRTATSPSYFCLAVDPNASDEHDPVDNFDDQSGQARARSNNPATSVGRGSSTVSDLHRSQTLPVDQRPEYAAFKRESESNHGLQLGWVPMLEENQAALSKKHEGSTASTPRADVSDFPRPSTSEDETKHSSETGDGSVRSPKRILSDTENSPNDRPRRNSPAGFIDGEERSNSAAKGNQTSSTDRSTLCLPLSVARSSDKPTAIAPQIMRGKESTEGGLKLISPQYASDLLLSEKDNTLLLDVRIATQYAQARISGALSLCIPTTLLKRPSFDTKKLAEVFRDKKQRQKFDNWRNSKHIIVYDSKSKQLKDASICVHTLKKFLNEGWKGDSFIIHGGFDAFANDYPKQIAKGAIGSSASTSETSSPRSSLNLGSISCPSVAPAIGGCAMPTGKSAANPFFGNIRQNTDLIGGVGQIKVSLPSPMTGDMEAKLPAWLRKAIRRRDEGHELSKKFLEIEKREQKRMQDALSGEAKFGSQSNVAESTSHVQIAGIEKGSKNRYNNIWPYEHSRVRLGGISPSACDYVNANHVQSDISNKRYIATQCPVPDSFADFWNMVWYQDVRTIVMLTAEKEGGHIKAHNYWKSKQYGQIRVTVLSEGRTSLGPDKSGNCPASSTNGKPNPKNNVPSSSSSSPPSSPSSASSASSAGFKKAVSADALIAIVRKFSISHVGKPFASLREITQLQYTNWPDFGAPAKPAHLLDMVEQVDAAISDSSNSGDGSSNLERFSSQHEGKAVGTSDRPSMRPVVVHCSAGCGRTGTFCTVDSVLEALKRQKVTRQERSSSERHPQECTASNSSDDAVSGKSDGRLYEGLGGKNQSLDQEAKKDALLRDDVDLIEKTVEDFRKQRLSMVQCLRQYVFCYEAVLEWFVREASTGK